MKLNAITRAGSVLVILSGFLLDGCSQSSPNTNASNADATATAAVVPISAAAGEPISECNGASLPSTGMTLKLEDYYSLVNNVETYSPANIRAKITVLPSQFTDGTTQAYFDFYPWSATAAGAVTISSTPLTFEVVVPSTNKVLGTYSGNKLDLAEYQRIAAAGGVTGDLTTLELVIQGTASNYQAIRVSLKKSVGSAADQEIDKVDMLIPAFTANPTAYATTHASVLNQIHPLTSISGNGDTSTQFQTYIHGLYCWRTLGT